MLSYEFLGQINCKKYNSSITDDWSLSCSARWRPGRLEQAKVRAPAAARDIYRSVRASIDYPNQFFCIFLLLLCLYFYKCIYHATQTTAQAFEGTVTSCGCGGAHLTCSYHPRQRLTIDYHRLPEPIFLYFFVAIMFILL